MRKGALCSLQILGVDAKMLVFSPLKARALESDVLTLQLLIVD